MMMNELGKMALNCRKEISKFHPHVEVGEFICMPNHIHGILIIGEKKNVGTQYLRPEKK